MNLRFIKAYGLFLIIEHFMMEIKIKVLYGDIYDIFMTGKLFEDFDGSILLDAFTRMLVK